VRAVIQRVASSAVTVDGEVVGEIGNGLLIFLGVEQGDDDRDAQYLANKSVELRVFPDDADKMNLSLLDVGGAALVVSQFTLCGDARKGRRPSFVHAAAPTIGNRLYQKFSEMIAQHGVPVETGQFQASMQVALVNDGPVTILLDSRKRF